VHPRTLDLGMCCLCVCVCVLLWVIW